MAKIALIAGMAVAGAFISVATGGLGSFAVGAWATDIIAGASVGASVGSVLSNIIFPPKNNTAPPMNDLQAMSSAYGSPMCWGYGGYRVAGQVIWAQTIKVKKNQQSTGGGKGGLGGGGTTTVYTYSITCAISFGFGPGSIIRLWADSKLIYDKTGKGPIAIDTGLTSGNGNAVTQPFSPVFYNGTATQLPDPTIQGIEGANSTSGYRDQIYMVLEDFPLADYGNRLPNFRAEITSSTALQYTKQIYPGPGITDPNYGAEPSQYVFVDQTNRAAYVVATLGTVVQKIDLDSNAGVPAAPWAINTSYTVGNQVLDSNGNIQMCVRAHHSQSSGQPTWQTGEGVYTQLGGVATWLNLGPGPNEHPVAGEFLLKWPNSGSGTGAYEGTTQGQTAGGPDTAGNFWQQVWQNAGSGGVTAGFYLARFNPQTFANDKMVKIGSGGDTPPGPYYFGATTKVKSANTGKNYLYCSGGQGSKLWVLDAGNGTWAAQPSDWSFPGIALGSAGPTVAGTCPPCVDPTTGIAYLTVDTGVLATATSGIIALNPLGGASLQTLWARQYESVADWNGPVHELICGLLYDNADNTLIGLGNAGSIIKFSAKDGTILASRTGAYIQQSSYAEIFAKAYNCVVPSSGKIWLVQNNPSGPHGDGYMVGIRTSDLVQTDAVELYNWTPGMGGNLSNYFAYDALTNSLLETGFGTPYGNTTVRMFIDRQAAAGETLDNVVADIWARTGADPALLDVTALSGIVVQGYPITQQSTGKGLLGPLMAAYFFDLVETNNKLVAVLRGQSVSTTIPETDMGIKSDNYEAQPTLVQEHDLPLFFHVNYYDVDRDYQQGKQTYRRNKRVKKTRNQTEINLPMAMHADDAAVIAAKCLQTAWSERNQWEFKLWKANYLTIDPTDVVQFTYNGNNYQARIGKTSVGANRVIEITSVSEDPAQYVTSAKGDSGSGFIAAKISPLALSNVFILDIPFLTDSDNNPTGNTGYYWGGAPNVAGSSWSGMILYNSLDNNKFNQVGADSSAVSYGKVLLATPAPRAYWSWDTTTVINVFMNNGAILESASRTDVLNGANWALVGGEIIGFCNATLQPDGSYNLDTLIRGIRGTEVWCATHQPGETFVLLDSTTLQRQIEPTSDVNVAQYFRGVTLGQPTTSAASQQVTLVGNDLKPYAPAQLKGSRS